jgi:tetratricopeptide (TPR) repeat protein
LLFEHLVPNPLKHFATDQRDILFLVDEAAAAYPLELLDDAFAGSAEPIAVRARVLRQLIQESDAEHSKASPIGNTALVVGDPDLSGSEMFPQLEGARREAEIVADLLARHKYETTKHIKAVGMDILSDLMLRANRIVHLAGHGVYDQEDPQTSGMVIGENHFLTSTLIGNMSHVPEFVFINCCHLGLTERLEDRQQAAWLMRHKLAANLATQFIRSGAKAVIAAGWPVDDAAALTFARTLYEAMMAGAALGPAVQEARKRTYRSHPDRNTWGAYQCYGDPEYSFHRDGRSPLPHERIHFVAPNQIVIAAEDLAQKIDTTNSANPEELKEELRALELDIKPDWLKHNSHIPIAMGRAFGELGNFGKAVDYFEKALAAEKSEAPIRVIEQLANYRVRLAVESTRVGRDSGDKEAIAECEQLIFEAIETVRKLDQLTLHASKKTRKDDTLSMAERWSLLGSAYKRLSQVAIDRTTRNKALIKMETHYKCAHDMAGTDELVVDAYPTLNWLCARAVRSLRGNAKFTREMRGILSDRATSGAARDRASPSYWNAIVRPEATVTMCLIDGTLDQHHKTILEDIKRAWLRGGSYRKASSVLEHFDFLIDVLGADNIRTKAKKRAELRSALITLKADISKLMGFSKDQSSGHGQT